MIKEYKGLVVFTASWCSPCQNLKNMLHENEIPFKEVDIDTYPEVAKEFSVRTLPTVFVSDGEGSFQSTSARDLKTLSSYISEGWDG